jgi:hypothetical protein
MTEEGVYSLERRIRWSLERLQLIRLAKSDMINDTRDAVWDKVLLPDLHSIP